MTPSPSFKHPFCSISENIKLITYLVSFYPDENDHVFIILVFTLEMERNWRACKKGNNFFKMMKEVELPHVVIAWHCLKRARLK